MSLKIWDRHLIAFRVNAKSRPCVIHLLFTLPLWFHFLLLSPTLSLPATLGSFCSVNMEICSAQVPCVGCSSGWAFLLSVYLSAQMTTQLTPSSPSNFAQCVTFSIKSILTTLFKIAVCLLQTPTPPYFLLHYFLISYVYCLLSAYPILDEKLHKSKEFCSMKIRMYPPNSA